MEVKEYIQTIKAPAYYYHCCYLTSDQLFPYGHNDTSERFLVVMVSECPSYHTTYLVLSKIFLNHFFNTISGFIVLLVSRTTLNSSRMSRCSYVLSKALISCCKQVFPIKSHSFCRIIFSLLYLQIDNSLVFL